MKKSLILLMLALCILGCGRKIGPLEVSFWYWHTPFELSTSDVASLQQMGVKRLFVRGGTFTSDGTQAFLRMPQEWKSPSTPFKLVLVYNYDAGLLKHFSDFPIDQLAGRMAQEISASAEKAQKHGEEVEGVQLDIDCPTRLLPHYARIVRAFKRDLNQPNWSLSVTGLASWLGTSGMQDLAREVDFVAPQFYETRMSLTADQTKPVSDPETLARDLPKASELPVPVYAGLACYGHAILYDDKGRVVQMYRGLSPDDALRHPALAYKGSLPLDKNGRPATLTDYVGEDLLALEAIHPGADGKGLGYQIQYLLPTPAIVNRQLQIVRREAPANCQGIIFYRIPEPGDAMALPLVSVRDALAGRPQKLDLKMQLGAQADGWRKVEASYSAAQEDSLFVRLTNTGNCPTAAAPNAAQVMLKLPGEGVEELRPGDFDSVSLFHEDMHGDLEPSGRAEANVLVLNRGRILPGQTVSSGEIRVYGKGKVSAVWRAEGPGGFTVSEGK